MCRISLRRLLLPCRDTRLYRLTAAGTMQSKLAFRGGCLPWRLQGTILLTRHRLASGLRT